MRHNTKNREDIIVDIFDQLEAKRMELAKALFSPQSRPFPLRNSKHVLRLAGELVQLASISREETNKKTPGAYGDS